MSVRTKAAATVGILLLAQPSWACGPSSPLGVVFFIAFIVAVKLLPILFACLVLWAASSLWTAATHKEPLRGRVTILSSRALGF
ncbi:MAG: hypothetical protein FD126_121 [Elusimicrobia bacterium]|nr:MAG: hypothetical protein FD126_121 [Elusimicrobiota bacterium]